jgi:hypothetical protein
LNEGCNPKIAKVTGIVSRVCAKTGTAVVGGLMSSPSGIRPTIIGKCAGTKDATTPWVDMLEGVHECDVDDFRMAKLGSCFATVSSINNQDISNPGNFVPAILKTVKKYMFRALDVHQRDKVEMILNMKGTMDCAILGDCITNFHRTRILHCIMMLFVWLSLKITPILLTTLLSLLSI